MKHRRIGIVAGAVAAGVLAMTAAYACVPGMDISISPTSGSAGTTVVVTGHLFPPGGSAEVKLNGSDTLCGGAVPPSGTFTCSFQISSSLGPGTQHIVGAEVKNADGSPHLFQEKAMLTIAGGGGTTTTAAPTTTTPPTTAPQQNSGSGSGSSNNTTPTTAAPAARAGNQTNATPAPTVAASSATTAAGTPKATAVPAAVTTTVAPAAGGPVPTAPVEAVATSDDSSDVTIANAAGDVEAALPVSTADTDGSGGLNPLLVVLVLVAGGAGAAVVVRKRRLPHPE